MDGEKFCDCHGAAQFADNVLGIAQLQNWAKSAERAAAEQIGGKSIPADLQMALEIEPWADDANTDAMDGILRIWTEVLNRNIATAVNADGIAYGQLIEFAAACLAILGIDNGRDGKPLGSDAIRARIRRRLEAYAARHQKTSVGHF